MFDVIVVGGGHAGIEAALAAKRLSCSVLLITSCTRRIGEMSCNPAIGGIAKGTLVREVDALDGLMGLAADATRLQFRMLNRRKGPAVQGPRVQSDAKAYAEFQQAALISGDVSILEDEVTGLSGPTESLDGVICRRSGEIKGRTVVLAVGTFLGGLLFRGPERWRGGRSGDISSDLLDSDIRRRMFHVERFKTGTPPRVAAASVDVSSLEEQQTEGYDFSFSFRDGNISSKERPCYLASTNEVTAEVAKRNMGSSPLMTGRIEGTGPRYCPSFEDKVTKFPGRTRHNVYVEPMGWESRLFYLNGISTSLCRSAQEEMVRSLRGFEKAEIASYGYAVEYSYIHHSDLTGTLRARQSRNLFIAGQICGTSGYEEAAAQGLLAGANAARTAKGIEAMSPDRMESYLGVMIDDITARGSDEPYRLFSSRAENRLHIRQDNADRRMAGFGEDLGTLSEGSRDRLAAVRAEESTIRQLMKDARPGGFTGEKFCRQPGATVSGLCERIPLLREHDQDILWSVMLDEKYSGYIGRNRRKLESRRRSSGVRLDSIVSYLGIEEICWESREVLERERPSTLAEAERIPGVRPTDLEGLLIYLSSKCSTWNNPTGPEGTEVIDVSSG